MLGNGLPNYLPDIFSLGIIGLSPNNIIFLIILVETQQLPNGPQLNPLTLKKAAKTIQKEAKMGKKKIPKLIT